MFSNSITQKNSDVVRKLTLVAEGSPRQPYLQLGETQIPVIPVKPGRADAYKYAVVGETEVAALCPCSCGLGS